MSDVPLALRQEVRRYAKGRCEYCLIPETLTLVKHEIDHVIALKHGGQTAIGNLALCCTLCNKHKGSDIASIDPETGALGPLFNPRKDLWQDHFDLLDAVIAPLSAVGRATVRVLQLNRPERLKERVSMMAAGLLDPRPRR